MSRPVDLTTFCRETGAMITLRWAAINDDYYWIASLVDAHQEIESGEGATPALAVQNLEAMCHDLEL